MRAIPRTVISYTGTDEYVARYTVGVGPDNGTDAAPWADGSGCVGGI